jgi:alpha-ketoglutarate-dependent taurine dioxygenase
MVSRLSRATQTSSIAALLGRQSSACHRCRGAVLLFAAAGSKRNQHHHGHDDDPFVGETMRQLVLLRRRWPTTTKSSSWMAGSSSVDRVQNSQEQNEEEDANNNINYNYNNRPNHQKVLQVDVSHDGKVVRINFGNDGTTLSSSSPYHASWLWSNDPKHVHLSSGQRTSTPGQYRYNHRPTIASAKIMYCFTSGVDSGIVVVHNVEEDSTEELQFPGPTMGDSCHPLATYGQFRNAAWMNSKPSNLHGTNITTLGSYLRVEWTSSTTTRTTISLYDMEWLKRFRYDEHSRIEHGKNTEVTPLHAIRKVGPPLWYSKDDVMDSDTITSQSIIHHDGVDGLVHIDYRSIDSEDGKMQLLHHVFRDGAAIVTNAPSPCSRSNNDDGGVRDGNRTLSSEEQNYPVALVAKVMSGGKLSHGALYGDIFHVRDDPEGSNNVAYTSLELCPHQDLAYYESPPGMQLLHCVANGAGVIGGESLLIDAMAAAYRLREVMPESFEILTRCPATFVKQRDGACMTYRTPHIVLAADEEVKSVGYNIDREIVAVWWSPPFEGPVYLPPGQVDCYYEAYADFEKMLNCSMHDAIDDDDELSQYAKEYTWERKLKPGEILVFNNRRMLHGRRGFSIAVGATVKEGRRHLMGCYTNIDDTLNSYRVLLRKRLEYDTTPSILNVGNGTTILP